jgi:hypothetical protein
MTELIHYYNEFEERFNYDKEYFAKRIFEEFNLEILNNQLEETQILLSSGTNEESLSILSSIEELVPRFEKYISKYKKYVLGVGYYFTYVRHESYRKRNLNSNLDNDDIMIMLKKKLKGQKATIEERYSINDFYKLKVILFELKNMSNYKHAYDELDSHYGFLERVIDILKVRLHNLKLLLFYRDNEDLCYIPLVYKFEGYKDVPDFFLKPFIYRDFKDEVRIEPFALRPMAFSFLYHSLIADKYISPLLPKETFRKWVIKEFGVEYSRVLEIKEIKYSLFESAYEKLKVKFKFPYLYFGF